MNTTVSSESSRAVPPKEIDEALLCSPRRLAAVMASGTLDASAEPAFDELTRLAATLVHAAASFVSIPDGHRDFYLSQTGFPPALADAREMSGVTFCHYALSQNEPLVIGDTHADPAWRAVPTVDSLGVRAYLGAPMIFDGQPIGSFCVIDVRPRVWTALEIETIRQLSNSAAREIGLRASLRRSNDETLRSRAQVRRGEETVAVIAHDLRTPLQVMATTAAIVSMSPDAANQGHAHRLSKAIGAMSELVDQLLAAHSEQNVMGRRPERVRASKLVEDAVDAMSAVAARADIAVQVETLTDVEVEVDYAQMLRSLCNLVGNCIKYCPRGSSVVLQAKARGGSAWLSVIDDGPGMGSDEQSRAFERGWQGVEAAEKGNGSGLGLAIVRDLVSQNSGAVELSGSLGAGTTVAIELPIAHAE